MPTIKSIIIIFVIGFLLFEIIEHAVFPLIWFIKDRKKKSVCGVAGMVGKVGKITDWQESKGKIFVNGELWRAVSDYPMSTGDKAVIQNVDGLTVCVTPFKELDISTSAEEFSVVQQEGKSDVDKVVHLKLNPLITKSQEQI